MDALEIETSSTNAQERKDPPAREVPALGRVHVVINQRAGTVLGLGAEALKSRLERAFGDRGIETEIEIVPPRDVGRAIEAARDRRVDAILVGGGDGSQRTAAHLLKGSTVALGVLPLGTMNRLARDLGIPLDAEGAANALADAEIRDIDVGEVNGRLFLCNSLMGLPLAYAEERQRLRGKPAFERLTGYVRIVYRLIRMRSRIAIEIDDGASGERIRALTLAVSNNAYAAEPSLTLRRESLDAGELGVYVARHPTGFALGIALLRALLGRWRTDPHVTEKRAHKLVIRTKSRRIRLSNDGEVEEFRTPLVYKSHPRSLRVLVPRTSTPAGA